MRKPSFVFQAMFFLLLAGPRVAASETRGYDLMYQGHKRHYIVHTPPAAKDGRLPVVMVLHGGGGNAEGAQEIYKLDSLADIRGFITVYPQGYGKSLFGTAIGSWNAGECCNPARAEGIDDVGFLSRLIDGLISTFHGDPKRIYVTGHSNGALMAYRLACEIPTKIAAIAPSGAQKSPFSCHPARKVPILHVHGTRDKCAPYEGGTCGGCLATYLNDAFGLSIHPAEWACEAVPDSVEAWAKLYGLDTSRTTQRDAGKVECTTYGRTEKDLEVTLCSIKDHGHVAPSGEFGRPCRRPDSRKCRLYKETMGPATAEWDYGQVLWDFFSRHSLP